jgi:IS605 OrfB family transposase
MWPRSWMEPSRTVSLPSSRVYEDEQPDVFAALSAAAHDFSRALTYCYNLRYDHVFLKKDAVNETRLLKEWSLSHLGYQLPDYYITSVENRAGGIIRSQKVLFRTQAAERGQARNTREEKISSLNKSLSRLENAKKECVAAAKGNRRVVVPVPFLKRYDSVVTKDGQKPATVREQEYLFECSIDRSIRKTKARIRQIKGKLRRADEKEKRRDGIPSRITFGSKDLYRSKDTSGMPFPAWQEAWHDARNKCLYLAGRHTSSDCNFLVQWDSVSKTMCIRLPWHQKSCPGKLDEALVQSIDFPYGRSLLAEALGRPSKNRGSVSYDILFRRDGNGRRYFIVLASFEVCTRLNECFDTGIVGIDCNVDNLAVCDISADGSILSVLVIPFDTEGLTSGQADDVIGRAVSKAVKFAQDRHKPIVMEDIDLTEKLASAAYKGKRQNRRTSLFAYTKILAHMEGICFKRGVGLMKVSPAYTSLVGKCTYLKRLGGPVHGAAAAAIARRGLGLRERVPGYLRSLLPKYKKESGCPSYVQQWRSLYKALAKIPVQAFRKSLPVLDRRAVSVLKKPGACPG